MKIGLSLSLCVKDILAGKVEEAEVSRLVVGTAFPDADGFESVLECYAQTYWRKDPERGMAIARRWRAEGRIEQPRMTGGRAPDVSRGHWVDPTLQAFPALKMAFEA